MKHKIKALAICMSLMGVVQQVGAQVYDFVDNGNSYAQLEITQVGSSNDYNFSLSLLEVTGQGNYDYIDQLFFTPQSTVPTSVSALTITAGAADPSVTTDGSGASDADNHNYTWSIIFNDGASANGNNARSLLQLEELESASLTVTYAGQPVFANIGVTLRNNGQGSPRDIISAPVPEPETYVMFLADLGLLGFVARKRHRKY